MKETFQTKAKQVSEIFKEYIGCVELTNISGDDNLDEGAYSFKHMLHQKGVSDENIENIFRVIKIELNKIADRDAKWLQEALFFTKKEGDN